MFRVYNRRTGREVTAQERERYAEWCRRSKSAWIEYFKAQKRAQAGWTSRWYHGRHHKPLVWTWFRNRRL